MIIFIWLFFWVYVPRVEFMWAILLTILLLMTVAYANVRQPLIDSVYARKKAKNKPVDARSEMVLRIINYSAILAIFAIDVIVWLFLPRGDLALAVEIMIIILLVVCIINVGKVITDIV
jgi:hypothetical protein